MAKKIDWKPAMDGAIAVGGGSLLDQYLVGNVQAIADLMAKLPADVAGISVRALILGAVALVAYKYFVK